MLGKPKKPDIGERNHRVTFESLTETSDGQGGATETWTPFWTCWAAIRPSRGGETNFAEQIRVTYDFDIFIRRKEGLNTNMRVKFRNKVWQVKDIQDLDEDLFEQKISVMENVGT